MIGISIEVTLETKDSQTKEVSENLTKKETEDLDLENLKLKSSKELKAEIERMLFSDENPEKKHDKLQKINDLITEKIIKNMSNPSLFQQKPADRKLLDETSQTLLDDAKDDISTSLKLKEITQQERAMQNYSKIQNWLSNVKFKVNDLRSDINRRLQDISVGLQRRSLLIGHYNYMGQGMGNPQGESMASMNPYFHF